MRITAVVFDLDGTLVRYHGVEFESSWGAVAAAAGVSEQSTKLMHRYLPRRDAYDEWVERDAELLSGISYDRVARKVFPPPYADGVVDAVERLRPRFRLGILSSGVGFVAEHVREELGLEFARANHLHVANGRFTGSSETRVGLWAKDVALRQMVEEYGIALDEICFVGDHVNDLPAMKIAGLAIAANPKDERVAQAAGHVIRDFRDLPDLIDAVCRDG